MKLETIIIIHMFITIFSLFYIKSLSKQIFKQNSVITNIIKNQLNGKDNEYK